MIDRDAVAEEVRENVEVTEVGGGKWYIAEGSYGKHTTVVQRGSKVSAIEALITELRSRTSLDECHRCGNGISEKISQDSRHPAEELADDSTGTRLPSSENES